MAAKTVLNYIPRDSFVHKLTGTSKLVFFLLFSLASMLTYDTRIMVCLLVFSIILFKLSKIKLKEVITLFYFFLAFLSVNFILVYFFSPEYGCQIYNSRTVICHLFGKYYLTWEQLFYQINVYMKYFISLPIALVFISTTDPSELASSLNRIGISYKVSYSVSLALRYIPDIQRDYHNISQAQQARGVELGRNVPLTKRLKNAVNILLPLLLSSLSRVDIISNAMELRGFGKEKKRTWYAYRQMKRNDWIAITLAVVILVLTIVITYWDGNRFYNPFI